MSIQRDDNNWHLDKRVPVVIIAAIVAQTLAVGVWVGSLENRVTNIEMRQNEYRTHIDGLRDDRRKSGERLATLEEALRSVQSILLKIDRKIDNLR